MGALQTRTVFSIKALFANFLPRWSWGRWVGYPARTVRDRQGWLFLAIFCGASATITLDCPARHPALLRRRLVGEPFAERQMSQKIITLFASIGFLSLLLVPALDHRFGWSHVPVPVVIAGDILIAAGFAVVFRVFRENTFTSARIEIAKEQRVITTGPDALVRHPMYAGAFLYLVGNAAGARFLWGLVALVPWRRSPSAPADEEALLASGLPGYADDPRSVRWRLIPGIF